MPQRHWVTITAENREQIIALREQGLEIFRSTVKARASQRWSVDGLLKREEIEDLHQQGYRVMVRRTHMNTTALKQTEKSFESLDDIASDKYLSVQEIDQAIDLLAQTYPTLCSIVELPHKTHQNRRCRMLRLGIPSETPRPGLLIVGGAHARELVNPDLLVFLARELCRAYRAKEEITLEGIRFSAARIQAILERVDLFITPLVNPDGRNYVLSGNWMWRKNLNPNPGMLCTGVDLNRNFDFLWSSGIGTSTSSCSDIYKGEAAFSEPESRNIKHIIDTYTNLMCVVDVHSYSELIMYPWGDDDVQSNQPEMNFKNTTFDGIRGTLGDDRYKEYIPTDDLAWYVATGERIQNAITAVRGREYSLGPSADLYPTTGTAGDYPYTRTFQSADATKLYSYTIETGREFQPSMDEARQIIKEVSAGLLALCEVIAE